MPKANPIKDEAVLREAKKLVQPNQKWTGEHHQRLIWALFRTELGYKPNDADKAKFAAKWVSLFDNGALGYASNCAKRLADAGVCQASASNTVTSEFC